jgi:hypothetical protein
MGRFYITLFLIGNFFSSIPFNKLNALAAIIIQAIPSPIFHPAGCVFFRL